MLLSDKSFFNCSVIEDILSLKKKRGNWERFRAGKAIVRSVFILWFHLILGGISNPCVASSCFGSLGSSSSGFGPINHIIPQANYPSSATERQETFKLICSF